MVVFFLQRRYAFGIIDPVDQVVLVLEMIIEALAVHVAGFTDIADGNFGKWLRFHQFFQRGSQRPFGNIGISQEPRLPSFGIVLMIPQNAEEINRTAGFAGIFWDKFGQVSKKVTLLGKREKL